MVYLCRYVQRPIGDVKVPDDEDEECHLFETKPQGRTEGEGFEFLLTAAVSSFAIVV